MVDGCLIFLIKYIIEIGHIILPINYYCLLVLSSAVIVLVAVLSAFVIALLASPIPLASFCTSSATTAKPFPASPALAASMEALSASIFCRLLNPSINLTLSLAVASWLAAA